MLWDLYFTALQLLFRLQNLIVSYKYVQWCNLSELYLWCLYLLSIHTVQSRVLNILEHNDCNVMATLLIGLYLGRCFKWYSFCIFWEIFYSLYTLSTYIGLMFKMRIAFSVWMKTSWLSITLLNKLCPLLLLATSALKWVILKSDIHLVQPAFTTQMCIVPLYQTNPSMLENV